MNEEIKLWDDINLMLDNIKNHPFKVIKHDDPIKLIYGFKSEGDDTIWLIKLSKLINIDKDKIKLPGGEFSSKEILNYLNLTNDERIIKNIIE